MQQNIQNFKLSGDYFTFADIRDGETTIHTWEIAETTDDEKKICMALLKNRRKKNMEKKMGIL